ncbi:hypothetical protein MKZ38_002173 [Zalerion maritima]|uniref:Uncharacterized protein n=1 Tax=Zalerion maritima TaxID=339359 RepID=A0AAD5RPD9_9PEZI|nr:hypothetical protein MKZ38_002173 [Zalerion maritima]
MKDMILSLLPSILGGVAVTRGLAELVDEQCCFELRSKGKVEDLVSETNTGIMRVFSNCPKAAFCLDLGKGILTDKHGSECNMSGVEAEFQCHDNILVTTKWNLTHGPDVNTTALIYDENPVYLGCPADHAGPDAGYDIYGVSETNPDCFPVYLLLDYSTQGCPQLESLHQIPETPYNAEILASSLHRREVNEATQTAEDTPAQCKIDPNGPSMAPTAVRVSDLSGQHISMPMKGEVLISPTRQTYYMFNLPEHWAPEDTELCAVQFRFPFCSDLPKDYPCFKWTGLEHDTLAEAGMHWEFMATTADETTPEWKHSSSLFQLTAAEVNKTVGLIECSHDDMDRTDEYLVNSVNQFGIHYLQAGPESGFRDGVGAFMVPCVPE